VVLSIRRKAEVKKTLTTYAKIQVWEGAERWECRTGAGCRLWLPEHRWFRCLAEALGTNPSPAADSAHGLGQTARPPCLLQHPGDGPELASPSPGATDSSRQQQQARLDSGRAVNGG